MPLLIQQQVFGLQVSVDDMPFVKVFEGTHHSGRVELRVLLAAIEALVISEEITMINH